MQHGVELGVIASNCFMFSQVTFLVQLDDYGDGGILILLCYPLGIGDGGGSCYIGIAANNIYLRMGGCDWIVIRFKGVHHIRFKWSPPCNNNQPLTL